MQFQGKKLITFSYLNRNNYHLKIDKKKNEKGKKITNVISIICQIVATETVWKTK